MPSFPPVLGGVCAAVLVAAWAAIAVPRGALGRFPREGTFRVAPTGGVTDWSAGQQVATDITAVLPSGAIDTSFSGVVDVRGISVTSPINTQIVEPFTDTSRWTRGSNAAATFSIVSDGPTGSALQIVGGSNYHSNQLYHDFGTNLKPRSMSFYMKSSAVDRAGPYVTVREYSGSSWYYAQIFGMRHTGQIYAFRQDYGPCGGFLEPSCVNIPYDVQGYNANQWYKIDLLYDWSNYTIDVWVDGVEARAGIPMHDGSGQINMRQLEIYNFDSTTGWIADLRVVMTDESVQTVPLSPAQVTLSGGTWSGTLSPSAPASNFHLEAYRTQSSPARDASGRTNPAVTVDTGCNPGFYEPTGGGACTPCALGSAVNAAGTRDSCPLCSGGYYQDTTGQTTCDPCPANTYRVAQGATDVSDCLPCPGSDTSDPGSTSCSACPLGQHPNPSCVDCGSGMFSDGATCTTCPAGTWHAAPASGACTECGPGTGHTLTGQIASSACQNCLAGSFNDGNSQGICVQCPPGSYQDQPGRRNCTLCPRGTYSTAPGGDSLSSCTPCPEGSASDVEGANSVCPSCLAGYIATGTGNQQCSACAARTYAPGGTGACLACPGGTAGNVPSLGSCDDCVGGTFSPDPIGALGAQTCSNCSAGSFSNTRASSCTLCPIGTYSTAIRAASCLTCPPKETTESPGATACVAEAASNLESDAEGDTVGFEWWWIVIIAACVCCVFCLLIVAMFLLRKHHRKQEKMLADELATRPVSAMGTPGSYTPRLSQDSFYAPMSAAAESGSPGTYQGLSAALAQIRPDLNTQTVSVADFDVSTEIQPQDVSLDNAKVLGNGAYGVVYMAQYQGQNVAVKEIRQDAVSFDEMGKFIEEAHLMATMEPHPNILAFRGIVKDPFCLVVEYIDGGDLEHKMKDMRAAGQMLSLGQQVPILTQVALGMAHLAKQGILHRDLAARNVLVTVDLAQCKLADFGLSRLCDTSSVVYSKSDVGPLKWMAPEAIRKKKYSEKSDVWSFGILAREVLTMDDPFPGMDAVQAATEICSGNVDLTPPTMSTDLAAVLQQCNQVDLNARPGFAEIAQQLMAVPV